MESEWIKVAPTGATSSKGTKWSGNVKIRDPKKVIVYFHGGGVSVDAYTAARAREGFYADEGEYDPADNVGIPDDSEENPFRDWSVFDIAYSTGDVHVGRGDFPYVDLEGNPAVLRHKGYVNYTLFMKEAVRLVPSPEKVIICGFSAGAFGAALLADDVISKYFPNASNVTVLPDSGILLYDKWKECAEKIWDAPREITARMTGLDATVDSLVALREKYGEKVKILYATSVRDNVLNVYQSYIDGFGFKFSRESCDRFYEKLARTVGDLIARLPSVGLYLWDEPVDCDPSRATKHTVICFKDFYRKRYAGGLTCAEWLADAVDGHAARLGLEKLFPKGSEE